MSIFRKMASSSKGLRYKLLLAFCLMSIIPLLACMYVISFYVLPQPELLTGTSVVVTVAILIALLGLFLAKSLIDPVVDMAIEAKIIASGNYDKNISVSANDEVGNLALSINTMTQKIKTNLDELKSYGQKMRDINSDVHKKVLALSSLLQIGDSISSGSIELAGLLDMAVEKAVMVFDSGFGVLYMAKDDESDFFPKVIFGSDAGALKESSVKRKSRGLLENIVTSHTILTIDSGTKPTKEMEDLRANTGIRNIVAVPVYSGRKNFGLLLLGNRSDNFKYRGEDIELVKVFAKQITIAIESEILNRRAKELEIKDDLTDLYNKSFIIGRLSEEIKRAIFYQRPCSLVLLAIDNFGAFRESHGELASEDALRKLARILKDNMIPVGKAARIDDDRFAMLLPEKNKREALLIADDIRKRIEASNFLKDGTGKITISGSVSENPIDGVTGDELYKKASALLEEAASSGENRVIM